MNTARPAAAYRPYTLIAELTYRCALRCAYCSNPAHFDPGMRELDAAAWGEVFEQAEALGVVQVHLSGGEPLLRRDLSRMVERACEVGLYTNLITSAVPASRERLAALKRAGLDAIQISIQGTTAADGAYIAGRDYLREKLEAAAFARALELPLTLNVVLHRGNIAELPELVELALRIGASRLELANTQYLGTALQNRDALLPSAEQIERAREQARAARERHRGELEILFVLPDYRAGLPRACMDGWGRRYIVVSPDGLVLPCHQAHTLAGLSFERAGSRPLAEIWAESSGLNAFRGEAWMPEPCRSCDKRGIDFGGCRCQAYHLTGDAAATDPACALAPAHARVQAVRAVADAGCGPLVTLRSRSVRQK